MVGMVNDPTHVQRADQIANMAVAAERRGDWTRASLEFTRAAGAYEHARKPGDADECRQRAQTASVA